jgi:hypothetical protein
MYFKHKAFVVDMEPLMSYAEAVKMCGDIYFSGAQMYIETHRESDGIYEFSRDSNQAWRNARERWRQEAFELGIKQSRTI